MGCNPKKISIMFFRIGLKLDTFLYMLNKAGNTDR